MHDVITYEQNTTQRFSQELKNPKKPKPLGHKMHERGERENI